MAEGLIERNKRRTRRELAEAASRLFLERGYASTTVQDIVDAVDISPRTFFRYFPCKEDVITAIASVSMDDAIDHLAGHHPDEPLGVALRDMMAASLSRVQNDPASARAFQAMLRDTPTLRARWLEERRRSRDRLAEAIAALDLILSDDDLAAIEAAVPAGAVAGERYDAAQVAMLDSER